MRRLPVYLLIDTSGSMRGESIHAVNVGIQTMLNALRQDPYAYGEAIKEVKKRSFGSIIACAVGPKAKHDHLKELTTQVVALETLDSNAFSGFFKWVSASVASGSSSAGVNTDKDTLPPPPPEIQLVL